MELFFSARECYHINQDQILCLETANINVKKLNNLNFWANKDD